jgi:endogenous inhibitor of DNA gyrase (YacG/DUF329 family)
MSLQMAEAAKPRKGCPICGKPESPEFRPFCSRRCADVDLNRWLSGVYRVETKEAPEEAETSPVPAPESED